MALVKRVAVPPANADGGRVVVGRADDKFLHFERTNTHLFVANDIFVLREMLTEWMFQVGYTSALCSLC